MSTPAVVEQASDRPTAIADVRAVTPDGVVDGATVVIEAGIVVDVVERGPRPPRTVDGRGLLLLPGLVDAHSDGLEKEIRPRRTAELPAGFAIGAFEARVRAAGVTTVFHGIGYQEREQIGRSVSLARDLDACIRERRGQAGAGVDHRILYRFEARDPVSLSPLIDDLAAHHQDDEFPLISFEDHTPGQGQYRDPAQFAAAVDPEAVPEGTTVDEHVAELMAEATRMERWRDRNLVRLSRLARRGEIRLLAHDVETPDDVLAAGEAGATVAEFPLTEEAARAARDCGMAVVMGAPNALRGGSHSGNASAQELVARGLCDVLASDYLPPALLAAALSMAADRLCSLPAAVGLVTSGPAAMVGLDDRGRIVAGARADLVLVDDSGHWPTVVGLRRVGDAPARRVSGL